MTTEIIKKATKPIIGTVSLPGSKSMSNRALIMAALANGKSVLTNMLFSDDSIACIKALEACGVRIDVDKLNNQVTVFGVNGQFPNKNPSIYCHDAGTVTRFMLPVCATMNNQFHFSASKQMQSRPIDDLLDVLETQGVEINYEKEKGKMPLQMIACGLIGGEIEISSHKSSQFLSGLLMALPLAKNDTVIKTTAKKILNYVDMTMKMMQSFGIKIQKQAEGQYRVFVNQHYQACDYTIEPDLSTASYFAAMAAATNGQMTLKHINRQTTLQGDVQFFDVLEKMGCEITDGENEVTVKGSEKLKGLTVNMANFSDTFMTLACLSLFADKKTHITGIGHARLQESDRLDAISSQLKKLGADISTTDDSITINPISIEKLKNIPVDGCGDHRVAMSLSLVGLKLGNFQIIGAQCVSKTCPDYFERLKGLIV